MLTMVQQKLGRKKPVRIEQIVPMLTLMTNVSNASVMPEEGKQLTLVEFQALTDIFLSEHKMAMPVDWMSFFKRVFQGAETIKVTPELQIKVPFGKAMGVLTAIYMAMNSKQKNDRWAVANLLHFQLVSTLLQEATVLLDDKNSFKCAELSGYAF